MNQLSQSPTSVTSPPRAHFSPGVGRTGVRGGIRGCWDRRHPLSGGDYDQERSAQSHHRAIGDAGRDADCVDLWESSSGQRRVCRTAGRVLLDAYYQEETR